MVILLLHHFLENYGVGKNHLELHADNCAGQNKNNHIAFFGMMYVSCTKSGSQLSIQTMFFKVG